METIEFVIIFLLGASIGSFVNVIVFRHNTGLSPFKGSSKCFACGTDLRSKDLVPLLSYLWLKGRCRYCSVKLSPQYFLTELVSGVALASIFSLHGFTPYSLLLTAIYFVLSAIFIYDIRHKIIPDSFILAFGVLSLLYSLFYLHSQYLAILYSAFLVPLPFFLIWLVSAGRYIGLGDVKLMAVMGILLGVKEGFSAVLISFWIGFVYVSLLLITRLFFKLFRLHNQNKPLTMKSELPFAPFLVIGCLLGLFLNVDLLSNVLVQ